MHKSKELEAKLRYEYVQTMKKNTRYKYHGPVDSRFGLHRECAQNKVLVWQNKRSDDVKVDMHIIK